ncbi:small subunit processome component 20 homolog [Lytechinus pictus]|uniref:small subunit processome component 20 homolog n=1 Tax=Lytechinus pictus TaxID=7653 RepID=UPI0030B9E1F6
MVKTSSKSSHHKETNRFKFQTFSDRIAHINIDVVHRSKKTQFEPQDADSFFAEGLAKWRELNCTQDFVDFSHEISDQVQSFAQLVHFEDQIVLALQTHLKVPDSMAYIPLLDLVVQLARDLQTDFYPHFKDFFEIVVSLLDTQDTELIEGAFQCLCYMFKYLWRYLVRDIQDVYKMYSPLLGEERKEYIRRFAAESFAFMMRKVKDHGDLFDFMLGNLQDSPQQAKGLGHLLFDMLKGVRHQTHSSAVRILPVLLSRLGPCRHSNENAVSLPWDLVLECFQEMFRCLGKYLKREHSQVIWDALSNEASFLEGQTNAAGQLDSLVQLLDQMTRFHNGSLIANPRQLSQYAVKAVKRQSLPEAYGKTALSLVSSLLQATNGNVHHVDTTALVDSVYQSNYSSQLVFEFSRSVFHIDNFEEDVLPALCEYCHSKMAHDDTVTMETMFLTLADLVSTKRTSVTVGEDIVDYRPYPVDFSRQIHISKAKRKQGKKEKDNARNVPVYLSSYLHCQEDYKESHLWAALVSVPHVRPVDKSECCKKLQDVVSHLLEAALKLTPQKEESKLYILSQAIQSLLLLTRSDSPSSVMGVDRIMALVMHHPSSPSVLLAVDCFLSLCSKTDDDILTSDTLTSLYEVLEQNLSLPHSQVRQLTLRILDKFPVVMPAIEDQTIQPVSVFRLCLEAEEAPVTVDTYREKLKCLGQLQYNSVKNNIPIGFEKVPLKFLLGQLYINFQLLWEPVADLIKSHAYGMEKVSFWSVFTEALHSTAELNEDNLFYHRSSSFYQTLHTAPKSIESQPSNMEELYHRCYDDDTQRSDRPDHINFRRLLWKAMEGFVAKAEGRSRELSPLLLRFIKNEYYVTDVNSAPTQDLRLVKNEPTSQSGDDEEDEKEDHKGKKKRPVYRSILAHLNLFSKYKDPKSLYLEPQLRTLYMNLLSSRNADIQKAALACLYTYNYRYLMPYKEQLDELMDDKLFRDALVHFGIDESTGVVDPLHREGLLPILFRILYGKMLSKTSPGTQGKGGIAIRRSVILRFIAGSTSEEMKVFMDLVMEPCKHLIKDDLRTMRSEWLSQDLGAVVPLRKQHSMLDTIGVIFSKLGHLMDSYRPLLFRLITCAVASYNLLLSRRDELQLFCRNQVKNLRQVCMQRLIEFFSRFNEYPYSETEIETVFEGAVYPQLKELTSQSVGSPSPLLRLAFTWSQYTRYQHLLIKPHPDDLNVTLLHQVIGLLSVPKVCQSVVAMVMDIVENLLMLKTEEEEEVEGALRDGKESKLTGGLSAGTSMLLPHIPAILTHLNSAIKIQHKPGSKTTPSLPVKELGILYKMSGFVEASDLCSSLVGLLLPYLQKSARISENTEVEILSTIKNLMKLIDDTSCFLNPVSRLLYRTTSRTSRLVLVQIFSAMAIKDSALDDIARTVSRLNAWDRKRLDEPDYTLRLKAFRLANQMLEDNSQKLDVRFFTPLIHNCFYFILKIDDMSLRDNSSHMINGVIKKLQKDDTAFVTIIEHTFIPALRDGLRAKTEVARHESLAILSQLVQAFPTHPHFETMSVLLDPDVEVDFFENIRHIQHHRRMRALRRLSKFCQEGKLSGKVVQHFLLPVATSMIFDPEVAKNMNLVVEAIAAVGGMATVLSWQQYLRLLTQYLRLLMRSVEFQKLAVRLIVAVLDAFHFDLSMSAGVEDKEKPVTQDENQDGRDETSTGEKESTETKEDEDDDDDGEEAEEEDDESEDDSGIDEEKDKIEKEKEKQVAIATRIHRTIVRSILPQLHKIITKKTRSEGEHKKARNKIAQDEEVLRVPIALAVIKLLQALPKETMNQHLYSVLLKVCQMLRSRSLDIRNITRDTLVKILDSLGVKYFGLILKQLRNSLARGFELHVLGFTVHLLLKNISPKLTSGDLDSCLDSLTQVFNQELFGAVSEEKEVEGIVGKLLEARSIKAYDCYEVVSKFVGQGSITKLITPLKEILDRSNSHRAVNRVRETLRRCTMGIQENAGISQDALLIFIHGLTSETLPLLKPPAKNEKKGSLKAHERPPSTYLLLPAPTRAGLVPETSTKTHIHLLVEFGLQLLNTSLKRSKFVSSSEEHLGMLDPFIIILYRSMESQHTRVITCALRCLSWLLRFPLPSLGKMIKQLTQSLFRLLRKHARVGAAKGDNFELMVVTFKAVTVLIRDVKLYTINEKQLQVLLAYAEEDIHDYTRQATAFTMLKAIMTRKLVAPEIHSIMGKISDLSVTQQSNAVRLQCRQVMHQFLLDYPLGKKLKRHLEFYVKQLSFSVESGRESALEMLATIFSSFPQKLLVEHAGLFYIPMATRLVNDDSANLRRLNALAIVSLLEKLSLEKRDELFGITLHWLKDIKPSHKRLAAQLMAIFVDAEKENFSRRLSEILPVITDIIKPENLIEEELGEENEVKAQDHLMFHIMSALCKITKQCRLATFKDQPETITSMWESLESHLLHPHSWVRLMAARLFGELFAAWQPHHLVAIVTGKNTSEAAPVTPSSERHQKKKKKKKGMTIAGDGGGEGDLKADDCKRMDYLHGNLVQRMLGLADKFCKQLNSSMVTKELAEQVIKNLIFISKVVRRLKPEDSVEQIEDEDEEAEEEKRQESTEELSMSLLVKRMSRIAATEVAKTPKVTLKRKSVIKWMAAMALDLGQSSLQCYLPSMLHVVGREVNDRSAQADPELKTLCQEVLELLKSLVGLDVFSEVYASVQRDSNETRLARKRKRALEAVADPEKAALRKMKKQLLKKESRKRKLQQMRPTYHITKRPKKT